MAVDEAGDGNGATVKKKPLELLDLPAETQEEIVSHCSQTDLICLALVSKRCRELAAGQLYRNFHIVFPDDDDIGFDSPIDSLAGGLDTFTTSDYDYAQHLKDLSMDTLSAGGKGELSYQSYLYSASCGKFLNTLLYLTLRKARSLESFRWNIRVELSRPVYQTLHKLTTLKNLHIRMQAGESYYMPPPALPVSHGAPPDNQPPSTSQTTPAPHALLPPSKVLPRSKLAKEGSVARDPPTLSGFSNLKSLCVLDIDDLDIISELTTCVENSASTLTELQLSFSDSLANQARKPLPESDPEDSDVDDEFQIEIVPTPHTPNNETSGPVKAFRAQEERKVQEAALGRVLGVEGLTEQTPKGQDASGQDQSDSGNEAENPSNRDPRKVFISSIRAVSAQLLNLLNGSQDLSSSQQEILDTIERAARKYVESGDAIDGQRNTETSVAENTAPQSAEGASPMAQEAAATDEIETSEQDAGPSSVQPEDESESVKPKHTSGGHAEASSSPSETQGEHIKGGPEENGEGEASSDVLEGAQEPRDVAESRGGQPSDPLSETASPSGTASDRILSDLAARKMRFETFRASRSKLQDLTDELRVKISQLQHDEVLINSDEVVQSLVELRKATAKISDLDRKINDMRAEIEAIEEQITPKSPEASAQLVKQCMNDYVRHTRGLSLETLSIHLLPVKASVLSRAVNLQSLKQLTLLNVGNQTPIWNLLSKENKVSPLPLRSVFTDNVSTTFLNCMSQLDELHDLFMLERNPKYKPESFGPRSTTTMHQIRKLVLSKHLPTLKRLMIRDDSSKSNWDANMKTITQICKRGKQLEELGLSINVHAVHAFTQFVSGLVNLRALHIIHFRNDDTCIWVMRESTRFIVDSLSHRPELKLEWIALADERVDRIIRNPDDGGKSSRARSVKGKAKQTTPSPTVPEAYPVLPSIPIESDSESDHEGFDGTRLRFRTIGSIPFHDVWGVKIFEKEIRTGCL